MPAGQPDVRKKEQDDWNAQQFGIAYSKLNRTRWKRQNWHRYEDVKQENENMPGTLRAVDSVFPAGLYYYGKKDGQPSAKFNIYFDGKGCAKAVPDDRDNLGRGGLDEERRSAEMDFLIATQGAREIKVTFPSPEDPDLKSYYKKELRLYIKLAAEKGVALNLKDESMQKFLRTLKPHEVAEFTKAARILEINKEKCRMLVGETYVKNFSKHTNKLNANTKLDDQANDNDLRKAMFADAAGNELADGVDAQHQDIFDKAETQATELERRTKEVERMVDQVSENLIAQDSILDHPMQVSRASRLANLKESDSPLHAKYRHHGGTVVDRDSFTKALHSKNIYNDAGKTIKGVEEDHKLHRPRTEPLLKAIQKELADLGKRQHILEQKLTNLKTTLSARPNPDPATTQKIEKATKQLEALQKAQDKLNTQATKFKKANDIHTNMDQKIQTANENLERHKQRGVRT